MMKYALPIMIQDLWEENYSVIKKELGKKFNLLPPEAAIINSKYFHNFHISFY